MRYRLEILSNNGVSVREHEIDPSVDQGLRFWTGIENQQFTGECVVLGDTATVKEFIRVFDPGYYGSFDHAWAGPERCRLVITH